jgi:hypothetical protein
MKLVVVLSYTDFIMLSYDPYILNLFRAFMTNQCSVLSNAFATLIEMIIEFLSIFYICDKIHLLIFRC